MHVVKSSECVIPKALDGFYQAPSVQARQRIAQQCASNRLFVAARVNPGCSLSRLALMRVRPLGALALTGARPPRFVGFWRTAGGRRDRMRMSGVS